MSEHPLIVMVHGGGHWGGCFIKLANEFAVRGYPAAMPDLASHGFDDTPISAIDSLARYVRPVEKIVVEARAPLVLFGHSAGGLVLNYLGERYPEKIVALVYLAAVMPKNGAVLYSEYLPQSPLMDLMDAGSTERVVKMKNDRELLRRAFYGDCSERDVEVASVNLMKASPAAPLQWVSDITSDRFGRIPRLYIETLNDPALPLEIQRRYQADVPGADIRALASGHSPFFSRPGEVADVVVDWL